MGDKNIIEWSNLKQPYLGGGPTKLIFHSQSQPDRIQQIEKWRKAIYLPIMRHSDKTNNPHMRVTREL
jgi:hypothetical protein